MNPPRLIAQLRAALVRTLWNYFDVDHPDLLWRQKGQMLIALQSMIILISWMLLARNLSFEANTLLDSLESNMAYWFGTILFQLGSLIVPIWLAKRGSVRLGAHFMLIQLAIGSIKYGVARGYAVDSNDLLTMVGLLFIVPLAAALLRPYSGLIVAVLLIGIERVLANVFDPALPSGIFGVMVINNLTFALSAGAASFFYERAINQAQEEAQNNRQRLIEEHGEDLDWAAFSVAQEINEKFYTQLKSIKFQLSDIEAMERAALSEKGARGLSDVSDRLHGLLDEVSLMVQVPSGGVITAALRPIRVKAESVLDPLTCIESDDLSVKLERGADAPLEVTCAPIMIRRAGEEVIAFLAKTTDARQVTITDALLENGCWRIQIASDRPLLDSVSPTSLRPPYAHASLRRAADRAKVMSGSLSAHPAASVTVTIEIPIS